MFKESLMLSIGSIRHRKVSSILTILGIVIGITAIISLLSVGEGLQSSVSRQLEAVGYDKILVTSGSGNIFSSALGEGLSEEDIKTVEDVNGVDVAIGILYKSVPLEYRKDSKIGQVIGIRSKDTNKVFDEMNVLEIGEGRYFRSGEKGVAMIGKTAAEKGFEKEVSIGDTVFVKDEKFKIIGILKSSANNQRDSAIFIPMEQLRSLTDGGDSITVIIAKVSNVDDAEKIADKIEEELDDKYGEGYYQASTSKQIADSVGSIFAAISFVLGGIASIALIVAGVGIANTMFTSVMERTKEIGVMKAVGATNYNIMELFLMQSSLLGLFGGLIGCILGFVISQVITLVAANVLPVPFSTTVTVEMVALSLSFSVAVGIVSGILPARRAARMQPAVALRR